MTRTSPSVVPHAQVSGESARARLEGIPCEGCGQRFTPQRIGQRHCSGRCRAAASRQRDADQLTDLLHRLWPDDPGRPE